MASDSGFAGPDDAPESWGRPAWEDTPDETDADLRPARRQPGLRPGAAAAWLAGADLPVLLTALSGASDSLARLDARAAAAADAVRDGLLARLADHEAAGFLACAHAWVHPLDLALRAAGLTASTALAAVGAPRRALPQTFAGAVAPAPWTEPPLDELPAGDAT